MGDRNLLARIPFPRLVMPVAVLVATPVWRRNEMILGNIAGASVIFGTGLVLIWKRLEGSTFKWPPISDGVMRLSGAQCAALFDGLDWRRMYAPWGPRPKVAG